MRRRKRKQGSNSTWGRESFIVYEDKKIGQQLRNNFRRDEMQPEQRMITAAILLSVAQQKLQNVKWLGVSPSKVLELSAAIAVEARRFVQSNAFDEMCAVVDLSADGMRAMEPDRALEAYKQLTSDDWSRN